MSIAAAPTARSIEPGIERRLLRIGNESCTCLWYCHVRQVTELKSHTASRHEALIL